MRGDHAADLLKPIQVRPIGRDTHHQPTSRLRQRVFAAAVAVLRATFGAGERLHRKRGVGHRYAITRTLIVLGGERGRIGHRAAQTNEQIQRGGVHHQAKVVGHKAMTTEAITGQTVFQFLVAVFAFPALDVVVVGGCCSG